MGKRQRHADSERRDPSVLDRILESKPLTIGLGLAIVALFAGIAIAIVTLLGGDELGQDDSLQIPDPIGPPPAVERSAAADVLANKTWDEMTPDEQALVEDEVKRAFANTTFRADNGYIYGIDIFRRDGDTQASRQYIEATGTNSNALATQTLIYCRDEDGIVQAYRYIVTPLEQDFLKAMRDQYPPSFEPVVENTIWDDVVDAGFRKEDGRTLHGFDLKYRVVATSTDEPRVVQYWFDVETAQLIGRGEIFEKQSDTDINWFTLKYDQLAPIELPPDLEQPDCVKEIIAKLDS